MDKAKKKSIKRAIALICAVAVVAVLAAMPLIAQQKPEEEGPKASILSGTATSGSIQTELIGGGTLAEEEGIAVRVPSAVKLTGFLVSNGDQVAEGTALATVDRVTVMTAIVQVQQTLEYLSQQIQNVSEVVTKEDVKALSGGTVKILYAQPGESVQSVMLEHGALAVLSLDGLMAVDMTTESTLPTGSQVLVTLSDGTTVTGDIAANLAGRMIVTVEDQNYSVGEAVQVTAQDGAVIGSGELYIYSPWNATAYAGTVESVKVKEGDRLSPGKTLLVLTDVGHTATYYQLLGQRQEYEDLMLSLFRMYQTQQLVAPCDGVVSGVDKNSVQLLRDGGQSYTVTFLANSPNGDEETVFSNYVAKISLVATNGWALQVNPQAIPIGDYLDLSGISDDESLMTQTVLFTQTDIPVFTLVEGQWVAYDRAQIGAGDLVLLAADENQTLVWAVLIRKAEPGFPSQPGNPTDPTIPTDPTTPGQPGGTEEEPEFTFPSGGGNFGGNMGGNLGGNFPQTEPEFEMYSLDMTDVAVITGQTTVTLDITIDEWDVNKLQVGMAAIIRIDALGGQKYDAVISQIGNTGADNGGNSKFTVTLRLDRGENMLAGMTATAKIPLNTLEQVVTIPAAALVEQGTKTLVYTGYDAEKEMLLNPVEVVTGMSDGETVQILEGLSLGQTYYYAYYDTLEISYTPNFESGFPFGQ